MKNHLRYRRKTHLSNHSKTQSNFGRNKSEIQMKYKFTDTKIRVTPIYTHLYSFISLYITTNPIRLYQQIAFNTQLYHFTHPHTPKIRPADVITRKNHHNIRHQTT